MDKPVRELERGCTVLLLSQTDDEFEDAQDDKSMEPFELDELRPVNQVQSHADDGKITGYLVLASIMAAFGGILFGYDIGIISGAMLQLQTEFQLTCLNQEVVVCALLLGALIGSIVGGVIIDAIGRRLTIIINAGIFIVGALIITLASSYVTLVIGRLILGFAVSLSVIAECIYISEISPTKRRGSLVSLNELGITMGLLLAYLVNFLFINVHEGWRYMFGLSMVPAVIQGIGMIMLPPSPRYLLIKKREDEARIVLQKVRGCLDVEDELVQIRTAMRTERDYSMCDLFKSIDNMRGRMMIGIGLVFFQQVTGQTNVLYYAPTVFQMLGFQSNSAATLATVGLGFVKALATIVCLLCVDRAGRRRFLMVGTLSMAMVITLLGIATKLLPMTDLKPACVSVPLVLPSNSPFPNGVTTAMPVSANATTLSLSHSETSTNHTDNVFRRSVMDQTFIAFQEKISTFYTNENPNIQNGGLASEHRDHNSGQRSQVIGHPSRDIAKREVRVQHLQLSSIYKDRVFLERFLRDTNQLNNSNETESNVDSDVEKFSQAGTVAAKYIALVSLMCYLAAYSFSFGPVTWILLSEIFPSGIRGRATSFATIFNWGINLIMSLTFLQLMNEVGISWTFILYGVICVISAVFVYLFVPETKNRSLEQVSAELNNSILKKTRKRCRLLSCCHRKNLALPISHGRYAELRRGQTVDSVSHLAPFDFIPDSTF
ncbi:solute carrier family 2, facilitated glucose transporter member 10-like isoform X2 [Ptychodera flava]|uniref:solute carrier family 2, facilitated glucose transporter member 10-like isoform X2 n=1 Tax=Ptychodera flava TaxID=63121 RepID=UPI003969E1CA